MPECVARSTIGKTRGVGVIVDVVTPAVVGEPEKKTESEVRNTAVNHIII